MPRRLIDDDDKLIRSGQREKKERNSEREPLSWREKDRRKDQSPHASRDPRSSVVQESQKNRYLQERERKSSLGIADALFTNSPQKDLEKKILSASPSNLAALIDQYIAEYAYPESYEILVRFVEHPDADVVRTTLTRVEVLLPELSRNQLLSLGQSLEVISMAAREPGTRRAASRFLRRNKLTHV